MPGRRSYRSKRKVKSDTGTAEYEVVGMNEADPAGGKMSANYPLGEAFLGQNKGDTVEFHAPAGVMRFKILKFN